MKYLVLMVSAFVIGLLTGGLLERYTNQRLQEIHKNGDEAVEVILRQRICGLRVDVKQQDFIIKSLQTDGKVRAAVQEEWQIWLAHDPRSKCEAEK